MALSDVTLRQARAKATHYTLKDTDGLALHVSVSGSRIWKFRFYWAGQQQRMSLGTYPEIGLKEARSRRDEARALVAQGVSIRECIAATSGPRRSPPLGTPSRPSARPGAPSRR